MASPLAYTKGTKRSRQLGEYGLKRSGGSGKGPVISATFGTGWEENILSRLNTRQLPCSACGFDKPSGKCPRIECGHEPGGNRGW